MMRGSCSSDMMITTLRFVMGFVSLCGAEGGRFGRIVGSPAAPHQYRLRLMRVQFF